MNFFKMWPQFLMFSIIVFNLTFTLSKHGEYKEKEKYSFWITLVNEIIFVVVLYFGGFWNPFLGG
jgi:hypothetical protein